MTDLERLHWLEEICVFTNMFRQEIANPIVPLGHFTMWLQILMLYGKKTNREYGEIMVLSMMQMIGASAKRSGSAAAGRSSSLKSSFTTSAIGCSRPA